MKKTSLFVVIAALFVGGFAMSPARADSRPAEETWVGRIQRDGSHYDYVGRACPESAEVCNDIVATYRIVPQNPSAARAVRRLSGSQARLRGYFVPGQAGNHGGKLFVRKAERPTPAPVTVSVDETNKGQTVKLRPGDHLEVVLHSTYWAFNRPSDRAVISADGKAVSGPGENCPPFPGSGCGTVTIRYTAQRGGSAVVSAHRDSCGEAVRCTKDATRWALKVKVAG